MKTIAKLSGTGVYPSMPLANNDILRDANILQVYDDGTSLIAIEKNDALQNPLPAAITNAPKYIQSLTNYDSPSRSRNAITAIKTTAITLTKNMIGMNVGPSYRDFDFTKAGFIRIMDANTQWKHIQQVAGQYDSASVARLDDIVLRAFLAGCEVIYCLNNTASPYSRYPTAPSPALWLPGAVGTPGAADYTALTNFVNWLLNRYGNKITWIEGWNEPSVSTSYSDTAAAAGLKAYNDAIYDAVTAWNSANGGTVKVVGLTNTGWDGLADASNGYHMAALATANAYAKCDAVGYHIYRGGGNLVDSVGFSVPKHLIWRISAQMSTSGISAKPLFITEFGTSDAARVCDKKWFLRHILYWIGRGATKVSPYAWDNIGIGDMRIKNVSQEWYAAWNFLFGSAPSITINYINELPSGELAISINGVPQFI